MDNWITLKLNRKLNGQGPGEIRVRKGSKTGQPQERYWRDRLKDAEIDNCCELVKLEKTTSKKKDQTDAR